MTLHDICHAIVWHLPCDCTTYTMQSHDKYQSNIIKQVITPCLISFSLWQRHLYFLILHYYDIDARCQAKDRLLRGSSDTLPTQGIDAYLAISVTPVSNIVE